MDGSERSRRFDRLVKETLGQQAEHLFPVPTFLSPLIDSYANYSRFLDRPIVPRGLEDVDPREQYASSTSEVSKGLGRMLGVSPAKIDNVLFSYTGGLGRLATQGIDLAGEGVGVRERGASPALPSQLHGIRGFAVREPGASSESIERLYLERGRADRAFNTLRKLQREGRTDEALEYRDENLPLLTRRRQFGGIIQQLGEDRKFLAASTAMTCHRMRSGSAGKRSSAG
ncbi:MAG: LPD38 domain-containing protein [Longimicrobiales bacterium]